MGVGAGERGLNNATACAELMGEASPLSWLVLVIVWLCPPSKWVYLDFGKDIWTIETLLQDPCSSTSFLASPCLSPCPLSCYPPTQGCQHKGTLVKDTSSVSAAVLSGSPQGHRKAYGEKHNMKADPARAKRTAFRVGMGKSSETAPRCVLAEVPNVKVLWDGDDSSVRTEPNTLTNKCQRTRISSIFEWEVTGVLPSAERLKDIVFFFIFSFYSFFIFFHLFHFFFFIFSIFFIFPLFSFFFISTSPPPRPPFPENITERRKKKEERKKERRKKKEERRKTRRPKQVPFHNSTRRTFLLIACAENPHSDSWRSAPFRTRSFR